MTTQALVRPVDFAHAVCAEGFDVPGEVAHISRIWAASRDVAAALLAEPGVDVDATSELGRTPLMQAY